MRDPVSTKEAAAVLGVNDSRVRQIIRAGKLKARQFGGRAYLIERSDLKKVDVQGNGGKIGRPPKNKAVAKKISRPLAVKKGKNQ